MVPGQNRDADFRNFTDEGCNAAVKTMDQEAHMTHWETSTDFPTPAGERRPQTESVTPIRDSLTAQVIRLAVLYTIVVTAIMAYW